MSSEPSPVRRRRRARSQRSGASGVLAQLDWRLAEYQDQPVEPLDEDGVMAVHETAMRIVEEIGIEFLNDEACQILAREGCTVVGTNVRMDRGLVMERVSQAPASFSVVPRNPQRALVWGGRAMTFGNVASPPNVSDLDGGRRIGNRLDFQNLIKLSQYFNCIHLQCGYPVEPVDLHASTRHLDAIYDMLTLSDKVCHAYSLGSERIEDAMQMVRLAAGLTWDEFEAIPRMYTNINSSSPLKHDWPMLDGAMRMARRNQPTIITPFTLAGAMAPVTLAGAVAQQTAEALAAIVLLQCVRAGSPVVMGSFTSNVDMRSGAPAFGTPEYMRATQISGQMARFYRLPLRASNACAGNYPDAQATFESVQSLWGAASAHSNVVYHSAGWLEGGLCASFEKFIIDCELLQQLLVYNQPVGVTDDDLAFDAIRAVGPHDHFLGAEHTQQRYKTAFYQPFLSDLRNFESWQEAGSPRTHERANQLYKAIIAQYEPPPMDESHHEALLEFIERRRAQGGAPTDF